MDQQSDLVSTGGAGGATSRAGLSSGLLATLSGGRAAPAPSPGGPELKGSDGGQHPRC